jgi:hypothetical protein
VCGRSADTCVTRYLYDCLYCGYPTKHPSKTCPAHRDLAPPIPGLDVPYVDEPPLRPETPATTLPHHEPGT